MAGETLAEARTTVIDLIALVEIAYLFSYRSLNHSLFATGLLKESELKESELARSFRMLQTPMSAVQNRDNLQGSAGQGRQRSLRMVGPPSDQRRCLKGVATSDVCDDRYS